MFDRNTLLDAQGKDHLGSEELQFMDSGSGHWRLTIRSPLWRPPTDVFETEDAIVVRVEIAGMRDEDFTIQLDGQFLSIHGVRQDAALRRAYQQMEIRFGEFSIEMELPAPVVVRQVEAVYDNGFLMVSLPKARPIQIRIEDRDL
jgi:HSP20 family protein